MIDRRKLLLGGTAVVVAGPAALTIVNGSAPAQVVQEGDTLGSIVFYTSSPPSAPKERMRITADRRIIINCDRDDAWAIKKA